MCCYLKNFSLDFVLLVLKVYPIQVIISLPLWVKLTMGQLLLIFLCSFSSFFSYVRGILVANHFSLLLIAGCILAIQQIITHNEHFRYSFWSVAIFWTASETLIPWLKQHEVTERASQSFSLPNQFFPKITIFRCFDVCSVRSPKIFDLQGKKSTVRPLFPGYNSVSYDLDHNRLHQTKIVEPWKLPPSGLLRIYAMEAIYDVGLH